MTSGLTRSCCRKHTRFLHHPFKSTAKPAPKPTFTGPFLSLSPSAAPLSTVLSNRFGHRLVVMAGGLLISTGMVAAAFSQKVYHMYISIGVISGECLSPWLGTQIVFLLFPFFFPFKLIMSEISDF